MKLKIERSKIFALNLIITWVAYQCVLTAALGCWYMALKFLIVFALVARVDEVVRAAELSDKFNQGYNSKPCTKAEG